MIKKKFHSLLFLLAIIPINITTSELLDTSSEGPEDALRKKGCKKFCCLNVTGNETVGGDLTVGGNLTVNGQSNPNTITVENDILVNSQSVAALFNFGSFYFNEVNRASTTIMPGDFIPFPTIGAGTTVTQGSGNTEFVIPFPGSWLISWSVSFSNVMPTATTRLGLTINGADQAGTGVSSSLTSGQLSNNYLYSTAIPNTRVSLKNRGTTTFTLTKGTMTISQYSNQPKTQSAR